MGLGGTEVNIPNGILELVSTTKVAGYYRQVYGASLTANMLAEAQKLCQELLDPVNSSIPGPWYSRDPNGGPLLANNPNLIAANGDAEFWLRLCTRANPPPIIAVDNTGAFSWGTATLQSDLYPTSPAGCASGADAGPCTTYQCMPNEACLVGSDQPCCMVGNDRGTVEDSTHGIDPNNLRPWCVKRLYASKAPAGWPICSSSIDNGSVPLPPTDFKGAPAWGDRGAVNAAFSVFWYLSSIETGTALTFSESGHALKLPDYDQCDQLSVQPTP
jgi:hypothetical protein